MSDTMLSALDQAFEKLDSDAIIRELKERLKEAEKVISKARWYLDADGSESPDELYEPIEEYQQKYMSEDNDE